VDKNQEIFLPEEEVTMMELLVEGTLFEKF